MEWRNGQHHHQNTNKTRPTNKEIRSSLNMLDEKERTRNGEERRGRKRTVLVGPHQDRVSRFQSAPREVQKITGDALGGILGRVLRAVDGLVALLVALVADIVSHPEPGLVMELLLGKVLHGLESLTLSPASRLH